MPFLLAVFSGVLLALSLPPYNFSFLAWFALAPLLFAARSQRVLLAAGLGLVTGATAGCIDVRFSGGAALVFAWLPFLWFGILCALVSVAARFALAETPTKNALAKNALARLAWLACVGVAGEWLTTLTPLPINFAVTQHRVLDLIQIADITGIWGVSFLLWFANAAIFNALISFREKAPLWKAFAPLIVSLFLVLSSVAYTASVALSERLYAGPVLRVAAIQDFTTDDARSLNFTASQNTSSTRSRDDLTREAARKGAQLIVWSEEALGTDFQPTNRDDATRKLARDLKTHLVVGYSDERRDAQFNSASLISPLGTVLGTHRKIHLYAAEKSSVTAGKSATVVDSSLGKIGIAICFDTCWTNVLRDEVKSGAQIVAMPNFDPPTPRGVVHFLHGAMLPFRAIENRVPIVRADPNGQSGSIDASGRVLDALAMWKSGTSVRDVRLGTGKPTFFTHFGDWAAYVCVMVSIFVLGIFSLKRIKKDKTGAKDGINQFDTLSGEA